MDHIGIDVHKKESQICILGEDGERARAAHPHHRRAVRRVLGDRPRARILLEASTESEWVARCLEAARPRGHRRRPELRPHVCDPHAQDQDRSARCPRAGRGLPARGLPPRPSALRCPAPCARAPGGARRPGAHPHRLHQRDPRPAPAARLARADRQCRGLHPPGPRPAAARPPAARSSRPCSPSCARSTSSSRTRTQRIAAVARADARVQRLQTVPSIGPVTAAAFVAAIDDAGRFARRASGRGLPGPGAPRVELGRGPAARADHQGRPSARALAAGPGRGVDPARAAPTHRGRSGRGPCASPRAAAGSSPSSRWPVAWPASSMRCCAMAAGIEPARVRPAPSTGGRRGVARRRSRMTMRPSELARFDGWVSA